MSSEKVAKLTEINGSLYAYAAGDGPERAGTFLAVERETQGYSLAEVSAQTKVRIEHLEAIEATAADKLPATPYAVGFVKVYARFLDLDADAVAEQFKADIGAVAPKPVEVQEEEKPAPSTEANPTPLSVSALFGVMLFIGWSSAAIVGKSNALAQQDALATAPIESEIEATEIVAPVLEPKSEIVTTPQPSPEVARTGPRVIAPIQDLEVKDIPPIQVPSEASAETEIVKAAVVDVNDGAGSAAENEAASTSAGMTRPNIFAMPSAPAQKPVIVASEPQRFPAPSYPRSCTGGASQTESVTLLFDVTTAGRPTNVRVLSSTNDCFNTAALNAMKRWRFSPKTVNGVVQKDAGKAATLNFRK